MPSYYFFKIFTLCLLLAASSLAQDVGKIDSLKSELSLSKGETRFTILNELFKQTNSSNYSEALEYANQFSELAFASGDSLKMVQGGRMRAYSLMDIGRNEEAAKVLTGILGIVKRNQEKHPEFKKQIKFILNNAGIAYMYLGDYVKALDFQFQSLVIREEEGDKKSVRTSLNNIGLVFLNIQDYEKAIQYYLKAAEISEELRDFIGTEAIYLNIGLCYNQLGKYKDAIEYFQKGFALCNSKCNDNIIKEGLQGLGVAFFAQGKIELAKENLLKSLDISRRQNDNRYTCENLYNLGRIEIELKNSIQAINYLNEAKLLAESSKIAESRLSIYKVLSKYYGQQKDYQNSLNYQNKYSELKDSIYSNQLIKNLTKVQTNYSQRENLKAIAEKDQVLALQKEIILRQRRQFFFITVITTLIVALAAMLFYFSKRQQKINRELSSAKNLIQEQNERLESYNKELEYKVTERTSDLVFSNTALQKVNDELDYFIYKSSHDIRGPLVTLKGMCNIALMDLKDPVAIDYFKKFDLTTDKLNVILTRLQMVNYVTHSQLKPETIDFKTILDETIAFEKRKGVPDRFSFAHDVAPDCNIVSDEFLVRTVLENLIDNAVKFRNNSDRANPFVNIKLTRENDQVKVIVKDNGIGIHKYETEDIFKMFVRGSEQSEIGGVGLYLVKTAIDKVGGAISLVHSDNNGSVFQALFPMDLSVVISTRNQNEKKWVDLIEKQTEPTTQSSLG